MKKFFFGLVKYVGYTVALALFGIVVYIFARPVIKLVVIDALKFSDYALSSSDGLNVLLYMVLFGIGLPITFLIAKRWNSESKTIHIDIGDVSKGYYKGDISSIRKFYKDILEPTLDSAPRELTHIQALYDRSVYAITGGWLAGKTTAAGFLLEEMRMKLVVGEVSRIGSESYHDTFSFGNVNESISSFFNILSIKTGVKEFKELGRISSPILDMNLDLGPIKLSKKWSESPSLGVLRKTIYRKLKKTGKIHVVIIDDIDRLLPAEQAQWLRVVELLGQFHGSLILVIPINIREVIHSINILGIDGSYLEKILPHRLDVGVDIEYIKSKFNLTTIRGKRLYSKYCMSLALRTIVLEMQNIKDIPTEHWMSDLASGYHSRLAASFLQLRQTDDSAYTPEYFMADLRWKYPQHLVLESPFESKDYNSTVVGKILSTGFAPRDKGHINLNATYLKYQSNLRSIFADSKLKISNAEVAKGPLSGKKGIFDFWTDLAWPIIKDVKHDHKLSDYFRYRQIDREIKQLLGSTADNETQILINLTKAPDKF